VSDLGGGHALSTPALLTTPRTRPGTRVRLPRPGGPSTIFALVFAAELAFGVWMAARGFRWNDAMSRSASALAVVQGADPKLANIGFVWPPLPALCEVVWSLFYPLWPGIVSSGAAAALTSAASSGATAALLLLTARRLGLPNRLGWAFALLVAANPMLFLYGSNGMAEGVTAPFLTGGVAFLTLFWHTGERLWIAAAGAALALGVLTVYQGVAYGAGVYVALVAGMFCRSEAPSWTPQGRGRAIEGLGLLLLVPPAFAGLVWIAANAVIMGDPLSFIYGDYGYGSFQASANSSGAVLYVTGDIAGALALVAHRVFPFLVPLAFVLLVRLLDGRLWRANTLGVIALGLSVPLGMIVPMAFVGSPMGFLRYLLFPLFAAAGWGLYEIAISRRRRMAAAVILGGWIAAAPAAWWVMTTPQLGLEERGELVALKDGTDGRDIVDSSTPVARYLDKEILPRGRNVVFDSVAEGATISMQLQPAHLKLAIITSDHRFKDAIARPGSHGVGYFVMPDPARTPKAAIGRAYPRLWSGRLPGFRLVKTVPTRVETWRIYAVLPGARRLWNRRGGGG
jgi:hypothetical protein